MEGWCVKAYLNATQKTDYIRIQKELLKLKNGLSPGNVPTFSSSSIEGEARHQLIIILQVTVVFLASSIILTLILKNRRKIVKLIKNLFALQFANK